MTVQDYKGQDRKKGLGRGLDALFGEAKAAYDTPAIPDSAANSPALNIRLLSPTLLRPGMGQPRRIFSEDSLAELTESVRQRGVLQPILVRPDAQNPGHYEIIAGERRWRAAQRAELAEIPVLIQDFSDSATLEIGLIENLQRADLSPLEEAESYQRLMRDYGHSQSELGALVGKSRSHIANMLRLLTLPDAVKKLVDDATLSMGHARALVNAPNPALLALEVVKGGLSVRETEILAQSAQGKLTQKPTAKPPLKTATHAVSKPSKPASKDDDTLALESSLSTILGLRVSLETYAAGGALTIEFTDFNQLDDLVIKLSR